jgi:hypothetical protein
MQACANGLDMYPGVPIMPALPAAGDVPVDVGWCATQQHMVQAQPPEEWLATPDAQQKNALS